MKTGDGWTLWLDMVAEEHRERMLRTLPADFFGDTRPCRDITDGFELDTEPYRLSLDTPRFPTVLDGALDYLDFVGEADIDRFQRRNQEGDNDGSLLQ